MSRISHFLDGGSSSRRTPAEAGHERCTQPGGPLDAPMGAPSRGPRPDRPGREVLHLVPVDARGRPAGSPHAATALHVPPRAPARTRRVPAAPGPSTTPTPV